MKRRARGQGASERQLADLQQLAVEDVLAGMDINPVSLKLAATQLTAGNTDIRYARMGLYLMPYGPTGDAVVPNAAGTLEFLAEAAVVRQPDQGELFARAARGATLQMSPDSVGSLGDPEVGRAAHAALGARIAIMNPPFTNRSNMGEKFAGSTQQSLRGRVDELESQLVAGDSDLEGFVDKNSIAPLFVALADRCVDHGNGVLAMILPTIALTNASGLQERRVLAARFDLDTVLTCHQPGNINLSQNTNINESIVVMRRRAQDPPARIGSALPRDSRSRHNLHTRGRIDFGRIGGRQVHQPRPLPHRRRRGCRPVRRHRLTRAGRCGGTAQRLGRGITLAR